MSPARRWHWEQNCGLRRRGKAPRVEYVERVAAARDRVDVGAAGPVAALAVDPENRACRIDLLIPDHPGRVAVEADPGLLGRAHVPDRIGVLRRSRGHDPAVEDVRPGHPQLAAPPAGLESDRGDRVAPRAEDGVNGRPRQAAVSRRPLEPDLVPVAAVMRGTGSLGGLPLRPPDRQLEGRGGEPGVDVVGGDQLPGEEHVAARLQPGLGCMAVGAALRADEIRLVRQLDAPLPEAGEDGLAVFRRARAGPGGRPPQGPRSMRGSAEGGRRSGVGVEEANLMGGSETPCGWTLRPNPETA